MSEFNSLDSHPAPPVASSNNQEHESNDVTLASQVELSSPSPRIEENASNIYSSPSVADVSNDGTMPGSVPFTGETAGTSIEPPLFVLGSSTSTQPDEKEEEEEEDMIVRIMREIEEDDARASERPADTETMKPWETGNSEDIEYYIGSMEQPEDSVPQGENHPDSVDSESTEMHSALGNTTQIAAIRYPERQIRGSNRVRRAAAKQGQDSIHPPGYEQSPNPPNPVSSAENFSNVPADHATNSQAAQIAEVQSVPSSTEPLQEAQPGPNDTNPNSDIAENQLDTEALLDIAIELLREQRAEERSIQSATRSQGNASTSRGALESSDPTPTSVGYGNIHSGGEHPHPPTVDVPIDPALLAAESENAGSTSNVFHDTYNAIPNQSEYQHGNQTLTMDGAEIMHPYSAVGDAPFCDPYGNRPHDNPNAGISMNGLVGTIPSVSFSSLAGALGTVPQQQPPTGGHPLGVQYCAHGTLQNNQPIPSWSGDPPSSGSEGLGNTVEGEWTINGYTVPRDSNFGQSLYAQPTPQPMEEDFYNYGYADAANYQSRAYSDTGEYVVPSTSGMGAMTGETAVQPSDYEMDLTPITSPAWDSQNMEVDQTHLPTQSLHQPFQLPFVTNQTDEIVAGLAASSQPGQSYAPTNALNSEQVDQPMYEGDLEQFMPMPVDDFYTRETSSGEQLFIQYTTDELQMDTEENTIEVTDEAIIVDTMAVPEHPSEGALDQDVTLPFDHQPAQLSAEPQTEQDLPSEEGAASDEIVVDTSNPSELSSKEPPQPAQSALESQTSVGGAKSDEHLPESLKAKLPPEESRQDNEDDSFTIVSGDAVPAPPAPREDKQSDVLDDTSELKAPVASTKPAEEDTSARSADAKASQDSPAATPQPVLTSPRSPLLPQSVPEDVTSRREAVADTDTGTKEGEASDSPEISAESDVLPSEEPISITASENEHQDLSIPSPKPQSAPTPDASQSSPSDPALASAEAPVIDHQEVSAPEVPQSPPDVDEQQVSAQTFESTSPEPASASAETPIVDDQPDVPQPLPREPAAVPGETPTVDDKRVSTQALDPALDMDEDRHECKPTTAIRVGCELPVVEIQQSAEQQTSSEPESEGKTDETKSPVPTPAELPSVGPETTAEGSSQVPGEASELPVIIVDESEASSADPVVDNEGTPAQTVSAPESAQKTEESQVVASGPEAVLNRQEAQSALSFIPGPSSESTSTDGLSNSRPRRHGQPSSREIVASDTRRSNYSAHSRRPVRAMQVTPPREWTTILNSPHNSLVHTPFHLSRPGLPRGFIINPLYQPGVERCENCTDGHQESSEPEATNSGTGTRNGRSEWLNEVISGSSTLQAMRHNQRVRRSPPLVLRELHGTAQSALGRVEVKSTQKKAEDGERQNKTNNTLTEKVTSTSKRDTNVQSQTDVYVAPMRPGSAPVPELLPRKKTRTNQIPRSTPQSLQNAGPSGSTPERRPNTKASANASRTSVPRPSNPPVNWPPRSAIYVGMERSRRGGPATTTRTWASASRAQRVAAERPHGFSGPTAANSDIGIGAWVATPENETQSFVSGLVPTAWKFLVLLCSLLYLMQYLPSF